MSGWKGGQIFGGVLGNCGTLFKLSFRTKKQLSSMTILWAVVSSGFSLETQRGEGSESGSLGVACELL